MADIRIKELTELTELTDNDYFVVDNSASGGETKKYRATRIIEMIDTVAEEIEEKITPSIDTALAVGSASGDIASFFDGSTLPMKKLEVDIEPVQDLHGYDKPWAGGAGKNLFNMGSKASRTFSGLTFTSDADCLIVNGTKYGASYYTPQELEFTLPSGTYYARSFASGTATSTPDVYVMNGDTAATGSIKTTEQSFTLEADTTLKIRFAFWTDNAQYTNYKISVVISKTLGIDSYSPYSNICPISGWDECNVGVSPNRLIGAEWKDGYFINASGQEQSNNLYKYTTTMINVKPSTTYYVQMNYQSTSDLVISVPYYNNNGGFISRDIVTTFNTRGIHGGRFTTPNNCYGIRVSLPFNSDGWNLQEGTSIVADNTYTIDLDGTRYGGTLDVVSGVLTVDRVKLTNDYLVNTASYESAGRGCFALIGITLKSMGSDVVDTKLMASALKTSSQNDLYTSKNIGIAHWWNTRIGFSTGDETITTVSAFKQWLVLNGSDVVYELATPLTIQLTPTQVKSLLGQNNVWADCGEIIDCEYKRDATAIINSLIARIEALENQ